VKLGRTGLEVVPLGLAASYGIPGKDVERAFERGLNLFYWGTRRAPDFGGALRRILARDARVGMLMMRYNAAHPGAEREVFPHLAEETPGVVAYTTTSWGQLLDPALAPAGERVPRGTDCYRFVLSNRRVDACWAGPGTADQLDDAMRALDLGPMSEDELAWMRRVGESVHARTRLRTQGMTLADRALLGLRLALSGVDLLSDFVSERRGTARRGG
jgi:aryl-alcohol dehydrogenase-like predicted oxidoreductase